MYISEGRGQVYRFITVSYRDQSKNVTPRNLAKRFDLVTPVGLDVVDFILLHTIHYPRQPLRLNGLRSQVILHIPNFFS